MFSILQSGFKRITKAALVVEIDENDWLLPVIQCRLSIDLPTFDTIHSMFFNCRMQWRNCEINSE